MRIVDLPSANSIRVGRLFYKPRTVGELLARSVRLVLHEVVADTSYLSQTGSCTFVSHEGTPFVVTTRHQLKIGPGQVPQPEQLDTLRFASPGQTHLANVPVNAVVYETGDGGEAYHDLLFFKVQEDWPGLSAELPYFFPVADFANKPRTVSYIYGHPFSKNTISYDPIHAHVTTAFFDGKLDRSFQSDARFYRRYTYDQADYEVNGFSGGAVFSLIEEKDGWRVVLDGVILAAGNGFLHIVDSTFIHKALSKAK